MASPLIIHMVITFLIPEADKNSTEADTGEGKTNIDTGATAT